MEHVLMEAYLIAALALTWWWVFGVLALWAVVTWFSHVLPTLRRHGHQPHSLVFDPRGQWRQLKAYGHICRDEGRSVWTYRVLSAVWWITIVEACWAMFVGVGSLLDRR
jgi:hypothetical protein